MRIEGDRGARLDFDAYDLNERALAWIVEERVLRARWSSACATPASRSSRPRRSRRSRGRASAGRSRSTTAASSPPRSSSGPTVRARGCVRPSGIVAEPRPYGQTALVANFACERRHGGVARQWFLPDGGVLAWLPLPGERISIVWSAPAALAAELAALDDDALAPASSRPAHARSAASNASPRRRRSRCRSSSSRPSSPTGSRSSATRRTASIHWPARASTWASATPRSLSAVLADRGPVHDAGAPVLLERYARRRAAPVAAMQAVTDGLSRLFGSRLPSIAALRNLGLAAVSKLPPLRAALAQPALR
jgi:2-polyprenyl-6-methoxyphenol hydroxylase-like FAD-dependent oxidoreductase